MGVLIGSTGFVGCHLGMMHGFQREVHRSNIGSIAGLKTDLLVCAWLPAEKCRANNDLAGDRTNMSGLAQILASVRAERAVLISTIDVYQPAIGVDETNVLGWTKRERTVPTADRGRGRLHPLRNRSSEPVLPTSIQPERTRLPNPDQQTPLQLLG